MIYKILSALLILSMTSCDIEIDNTDSAGVAPAGIYLGEIVADGETGTPPYDIAIITSKGNVALVNLDTKESFIGTRVDNALTGKLYVTTGVETIVVDSAAEITSVSAGAISGTYTSSLGGGTFALSTTGLYERASELSKLSGDWIDSVYTNTLGLGTSTWAFNTTGSKFTVISYETGCSGSGDLSLIDPEKNEYELWRMSITNCGVFDGEDYTGFAILSDTEYSDGSSVTDGTMTLIFSNGVFGGMAQPIK